MAQSNAPFTGHRSCQNGQVIGIGSGTTIEYAVEAIASKVAGEGLKIKCVPTSFQALELLVKHKLEVTSLDVHKVLDVAFDGADEVCENLTLIKGGGGCLLQEKIVAASATNFIVLADERKCSKKLGTQWTKGLPIEVVPMALRPVQMWIEKRLGGKAILRPAGTKMGPQLTDNGNFLLDWQFDSAVDYDWTKVELDLLRMPGVVDTGLFIDMARKVYIGNLDGSIKTWGT
ncbi:ribose 5-phosphate isomerase A [Paragonimus westermani]|uniref:ribose-5-phosphate isomerase n=1 Tax=Paragonimus westermani TaxID=34504 RepID=A0A5J4NV75_9TREM|nr:ribose 5-phosphate isomerase A [Paragonimus westermani]